MFSIKFPDMFTSARTQLVADKEAVKQNIYLILKSDKTSLFGDPYYGNILKKLLYNQNDAILKDIIIDEIYTCIKTFIPQVILLRENIKITQHQNDLFAEVTIRYYDDLQSDLFNINLTSDVT